MSWQQWAFDFLTRLIPAALLHRRASGGPRYQVTSMLSMFVGEHVPGNRIWNGSAVTYLMTSQRTAWALKFSAGKIWDASGGLFDTRDGETVHSDVGRAIFVMDADGNFYASTRQEIGKFHHSSFLAGAPVAAAGEVEVVEGVLKAISDRSGHYRPRRSYTSQAIEHMRRNNISFDGVTLDLVGRP